MSSTFTPARASKAAAVEPAGPPPMTIVSTGPPMGRGMFAHSHRRRSVFSARPGPRGAAPQDGAAQLDSGRDLQLPKDRRYLVRDCPHGRPPDLGDIAVRKPLEDQRGNLFFGLRQLLGQTLREG